MNTESEKSKGIAYLLLVVGPIRAVGALTDELYQGARWGRATRPQAAQLWIGG